MPLYFREKGLDLDGQHNSQSDDAAAYGDGDRLRAVTGPQLIFNMLDVDFDRLFGNEQMFGNVLIAVAAGDARRPSRVRLAGHTFDTT